VPEPTSDSLNAAIATALGIHKEFVCPRCGGRHFGTVNPTADPADTIIKCHDERGVRCDRRWKWDEIPWPAFDTDGNAMLELIGAMKARGLDTVVGHNCPAAGVFCDIDWQASGQIAGRARGATFPLCVRDAAARALGLAAGGEGAKP
jgi:hypothetical protein